MRCPFCHSERIAVKDSRECEDGRAIRRRRECESCAKRFTTYERVEQTIRMMVIKKDGRRLPWDKQKILTGLGRACFKRPVSESELLRIADDVQEEVFATFDREVPSTAVGQLVIDRLRRVDQVAYVRFASVYRQFKTLEELVDEARAVLDARRYEDPGQGRLFVEPPGGRESNGNNARAGAAGASAAHAEAPAGEASADPSPGPRRGRRTRRGVASPAEVSE